MSSENLVPEGHYEAVCVRSTYEEGGEPVFARLCTSKGGTKQVAATFQILGGPQDGRRLVWFGFFTKDTAKRTVESLRYMGLKGTDLAAVEEQQLDQRVSIKVGHNMYDGKTTARVDFVNQLGAGGMKLTAPMSRDDVRKFAAMMGESMKKVAEVDAPRASARPAPGDSAREPEGDDIPF